MTTHPTLFDPGEALGNMHPDETLIWKAVQESGPDGGLAPVRAGRILHATKGAHPENETCLYCASSGKYVLDNLRDRQLVKRRRTGVYQVARKPERADQWPAGY